MMQGDVMLVGAILIVIAVAGAGVSTYRTVRRHAVRPRSCRDCGRTLKRRLKFYNAITDRMEAVSPGWTYLACPSVPYEGAQPPGELHDEVWI